MKESKIEIIHTDDDLIVINKPTGISVTKDRTGQAQLIDVLVAQLGPMQTKLRLIHRLDKDTSGVMLLAKNKSAQSTFSEYFAKRQVKKTYLAIVKGFPSEPKGTIDAPLARNPKNSEFMRIDYHRGKASITDWNLLADFGGIALLAAHPLTGRTHQIRVHMTSIGLPLAVDPFYSTDLPLYLSDFKPNYKLAKGKTERPLIDRLTLHAYQLELTEPQTSRPNIYIAGLDKKFKAALKMLAKHNPNGPAAILQPETFDKILEAKPLE